MVGVGAALNGEGNAGQRGAVGNGAAVGVIINRMVLAVLNPTDLRFAYMLK